MTPETIAVLAALFGLLVAAIPVIAVLTEFRRILLQSARKVDQLHRAVFVPEADADSAPED